MKAIEEIISIRRSLGLSQKQLAEKVGVSRDRLANYENDRVRLPAEIYLRILSLKKEGQGAAGA